MHRHSCIVPLLLLAALHLHLLPHTINVWATSVQQTPSSSFNVVLGTSCWTSAACRQAFKQQFDGPATPPRLVQLRVPWPLMYPELNEALIRAAVKDLQPHSQWTVEPLYVFENNVEMDHLQRIAHDIQAMNFPRNAFMLDSSEATENLGVITRELSIIHSVFQGLRHSTRSTATFYNVPPRSFLSTRHLHKYLRFVRNHVTGIRLQLDDAREEASLETFDEMLAVIGNYSLVPQVEVPQGEWSQALLDHLARHHVTTFLSIDDEVLQRPRRSSHFFPLTDSQEEEEQQEWDDDGEQPRQGHLGRLFPPLAFKATTKATWEERRINAKRNLEKLFETLASSAFPSSSSPINSDTKLVPPQKRRKTPARMMDRWLAEEQDADDALDAQLTREERVFLNSENPRFPKEDVTVALIDRRGDVNSKDYDYVELQSGRTRSSQQMQPRRQLAAKGTKATAAAGAAAGDREEEEDLELWEMESQSFDHPPRSREGAELAYYQRRRLAEQQDGTEEEHFNAFGKSEMAAVDAALDFLSSSEELHSARERTPQREHRRMRRDLFSNSQTIPIDGAVQSIFQEIRDNYPKMLERLQEAVRQHEDLLPQASLINLDSNHIETLLEATRTGAGLENLLPASPSATTVRKTRSSSSFIRTDPLTNEIGYTLPDVPVRPLDGLTPKETPAPFYSHFLNVLLEGWQVIRKQLKEFFW